jgi:3-phosphoglycerate kinase
VGLFKKKTIRDIDIKNKRVLMRADYNVPIKDGVIENDYRIKQSLQTIDYIMNQWGASLVIISHLGRPEGKPSKELSLEPIANRLREFTGKEVKFAHDCMGDEVKKLAGELDGGQILLLENVRFHPEEEKNDENFAKQIIADTGAEIFVQDGFGVVHRAHASTDAIAKQIPAVAGFLLEKEANTIMSAMQDPAHPLLAVVGGAKVSDKIDVLTKFVEMADSVAVIGAMANNFLKAQGTKVGKSLVEEEAMDITQEVLEKARKAELDRDFTFFVPVDGVVSVSVDGKSPTRVVDFASNSLADIESYPKMPPESAHTISDEEMILDIGPISAAYVAGAARIAKTVVWAGTAGVTETKGLAGADDPFAHGTHMIVEAMIGNSNNHKNKPFTVVGGGDTAAYVESEGLLEDFNHVSTGGSASLELMAGKNLPGIDVLLDKD